MSISGHSPRSSERKRSKRSSIPDGVDGGDAERITDGAIGGGASALAKDSLTASEGGDVFHDQEIPGEVELLDDIRVRERAARGTRASGCAP